MPGVLTVPNDTMIAVTANPYLDATVGAMLARIAERVPSREAIVAPDRRISYAELHRQAQRFARGLLALGVEGELWLRGRLVTPGYYRKPEETARAFTADGWFKTGDLAVRDEAGRTIFRGRLREVLRISHFMVAPGGIETFLMTHPKVLQAFVIGVPDPRSNEAAAAYVIPRPGERLTERELIDHCTGRIASFKIPRHVRIVADVPRTPGPHGDKVQRGKLREMFLAESTGEPGPPLTLPSPLKGEGLIGERAG